MATQVGRTAAPRATKRASPPPEGVTSDHRNEVTVSGRLSAPAVGRELPSGDEIVTWRLVVDRGSVDGNRKVDVVDCTTFRARVRRQALAWTEGDVIEVVGSLRRRFWRGAGGLQTRCEVEVDTASRRTKGFTTPRPAGRRRSAVGEGPNE
jgi:single-strand DNA-binding protein